jgi:hypothetical protein
MKATDLEQVQQYLHMLRRLAPHTVWFGSVSAEVDEEWEWMLESRGGGLPSSTEIISFELMARGGGRSKAVLPFIGATTERRHKGVRMTVDVGSAHLRVLAHSAEMKPFGEWLQTFYSELAAMYAGQAPVWEPGETRVDASGIVKIIDEARARWDGGA